jgi:hypothetical protein
MGMQKLLAGLLLFAAVIMPIQSGAQDRSISSSAATIDPDPPPGTALHATKADGRLVASYDNWAIRQLKDDKTYILVGQATGRQHGHLWLHCNAQGLLTVAVPMVEKAKKRERLRSQILSVRSDDSAMRELSLTVFESFVAIAMDYDKSRDERVAAFVDGLGNASNTFAVSYDRTTLEFNVRQFRPARTRFFELCDRMASK